MTDATANTGPTVGDVTDPTHRSVTLERLAFGEYVARNSRGIELRLGSGSSDCFTPVELLLAAIAGCSAIDVDYVLSNRTELSTLVAVSSGNKVKVGAEHTMTNLNVEFAVTTTDPAAQAEARARADEAIRMSQERLCTVSRTVARGTDVAMQQSDYSME